MFLVMQMQGAMLICDSTSLFWPPGRNLGEIGNAKGVLSAVSLLQNERDVVPNKTL